MPLVKNVMTPSVLTVDPSTSVVDAARVMIQEKKGPLPVVEQERLIGIITDRDLLADVVADGRDPRPLTVRDIATTEVVTTGSDQNVDEARKLMAQHELDRLLVVDGGRLVGIISEADIRSDQSALGTTVPMSDRRRARRGPYKRSTRGLARSRAFLVTTGVTALVARKAAEIIQQRRAPLKQGLVKRLTNGRTGAVVGAVGASGGLVYMVRSGRLQPAEWMKRRFSSASAEEKLVPTAGEVRVEEGRTIIESPPETLA